jgi:hypothetical protein
LKEPASLIFYKLLRWIGRLGAVSVGILTGILISITLTSYILFDKISSIEFFTTWLQRSNVVSNSKVFFADLLLIGSVGRGELEVQDLIYSNNFQEWERLVEKAFTVDWMEEQLSELALDFYVWMISGSDPIPDLSLDFYSVKKMLNSQEAIPIVLPFLQYLPQCKPGLTSDAGLITSCIPPQSDLTAVARYQALVVDSFLPDSVSLISLQNAGVLSEDINTEFASLKTRYQFISILPPFFLSCSLLALSIYALVNSRNLEALTRSLPLPFLINSGLLLLLYSALQMPDKLLIPYLEQRYYQDARYEFLTLTEEAIQSMASMLAPSFISLGVISLMVALLFYGIFLTISLINRRSKEAFVPSKRITIKKVFR